MGEASFEQPLPDHLLNLMGNQSLDLDDRDYNRELRTQLYAERDPLSLDELLEEVETVGDLNTPEYGAPEQMSAEDWISFFGFEHGDSEAAAVIYELVHKNMTREQATQAYGHLL